MSPRRSWNGFRDDKVKFTHPRADICCVFTKRHLPLWITERFPFFFFFSSPVSGRTLWNIAGKSIFGGACMIEGPSWWDGDTSAAMCHQSFSSDDKSIHHGRLGVGGWGEVLAVSAPSGEATGVDGLRGIAQPKTHHVLPWVYTKTQATADLKVIIKIHFDGKDDFFFSFSGYLVGRGWILVSVVQVACKKRKAIKKNNNKKAKEVTLKHDLLLEPPVNHSSWLSKFYIPNFDRPIKS